MQDNFYPLVVSRLFSLGKFLISNELLTNQRRADIKNFVRMFLKRWQYRGSRQSAAIYDVYQQLEKCKKQKIENMALTNGNNFETLV